MKASSSAARSQKLHLYCLVRSSASCRSLTLRADKPNSHHETIVRFAHAFYQVPTPSGVFCSSPRFTIWVTLNFAGCRVSDVCTRQYFAEHVVLLSPHRNTTAGHVSAFANETALLTRPISTDLRPFLQDHDASLNSTIRSRLSRNCALTAHGL